MALISASRRTDIPAFYSDWFLARLKAGRCLVRHPFRADWIKNVDLSPAGADGFVFWTRYPARFYPCLDELDRRRQAYYFMISLTGLPRILEPNRPPLDKALAAFINLSARLGPDLVRWRFDPLILSDLTPMEETITRFNRLADSLAGATGEVITSLVHPYAKTKRGLAKAAGLNYRDWAEAPDAAAELIAALADSAGQRGMSLTVCGAERDYSAYGAGPAKCVDENVFNKLFNLNLAPGPAKGQRGSCRCAQSIDIGAYHTCPNGCLYCYANTSQARAAAARERQQADWPGLGVAAEPEPEG